MRREPEGILTLNWMGKADALIPVEDGKYDYAWVDTSDPRAREVKTIDLVETVGDPSRQTGSSQNLLIIGDSGDALRSLGSIPEYSDKYLGKVKLVYIDPPFNTAQTFEHYSDQLEHSVWLTMMRDRIRDIKPLLTEDGSVWVHLDDKEVHRMRCVLDEEFGADRCATQIEWQKRTTRENRSAFSDNHDHILVYTNCPVTQWRDSRNRLPRGATAKNPDNDPKGPWDSVPFTAQGYRPNQMYEITTPTGVVHTPPPDRCWGAVESEYQRLLNEGRIHFPKSGNGRPRVKQYADEAPGLVPHTMWLASEVGSNDEAKGEIQALFPGVTPFDTPKPERLLRRIIEIATNPGDIVLDSFAGSGTTAAVAHKLGRQWVTVELSPSTAENFVLPRLTKVVNGEELGGVSSTTERVAIGDLPDNISPKDAQQFTTLLGRFLADEVVECNLATATAKTVRTLKRSGDSPLDDEESATLLRLLTKLNAGLEGGVVMDMLPEVARTLRAAARTRDETIIAWRGGGGFCVGRIGPSMYEVDDDDDTIYLSTAATNGAWSRAVAGQLKFTLTPDDPVFCGTKNRQRLAVIDGIVDETVVQTVVESLDDRQIAVVVAKAVLPEAAALLQQLSPGSRIRKAPDQMFPKATVK